MKLILLAAATLLVGASPLTAEAAYCDAWPYEVDCHAEVGAIQLASHRVSHAEYRIRAEACLAAPSEMVVAWWVTLSDDPPGAMVVSSTPTGDPDCPHRAVAQPLARFGVFDPAHTCGQVVATAVGAAGTKLVCDE